MALTAQETHPELPEKFGEDSACFWPRDQVVY
jgi:hypothetical protein